MRTLSIPCPPLSIVGFSPDDPVCPALSGAPAAAGGAGVLLAASGLGAHILERACVMAGPEWACQRMRQLAVAAAGGAGGGGGAGAPPLQSAMPLLLHPDGSGGGSAAAGGGSSGSGLGAGSGGGGSSSAAAAGGPGHATLPCDWRWLLHDTQLRAFCAAPVGPPGAPLGALCVASEDARAFEDREWWQVWLGAVSQAGEMEAESRAKGGERRRQSPAGA